MKKRVVNGISWIPLLKPTKKRNGSLVEWKQKQGNNRLKNILII